MLQLEEPEPLQEAYKVRGSPEQEKLLILSTRADSVQLLLQSEEVYGPFASTTQDEPLHL